MSKYPFANSSLQLHEISTYIWYDVSITVQSKKILGYLSTNLDFPRSNRSHLKGSCRVDKQKLYSVEFCQQLMYEIKKWNHNNLPIFFFFLFDGGSISWWFAPHPTPWRHLSLPPFSFLKFWKNNCIQKEINISKLLNMFHFSCQTSQHYQKKSSCLERKKTTLCLQLSPMTHRVSCEGNIHTFILSIYHLLSQ